MKFVVFGLSLSSSWGNGHATLWRGLTHALARRGHRVVFFERDLPYYAQHRDLVSLDAADLRFLIGGALYPEGFAWTPNLHFVRHVPPSEHAAFYGSSRFTLSVTRGAMAEMGWCPSGRLFEAAACGTPVISDSWEGVDAFFVPGREAIVARSAADVIDALALDEASRLAMGAAARARALRDHTADVRARELEAAVAQAAATPLAP
jgi:spore maturation protein CgeB